MGRLDGKVAIITGAARGMGESHARTFIREGASVVLTDRLGEQGRALAAELGERAAFVEADVTSAQSWQEVVATAGERFGPPTVLVNNAGILLLHSLDDVTVDDYRKVVEVNQIGVLLGMQAVLPSMRTAGVGSIINIASTVSVRGSLGIFAYGASKWAVRGMTKSAALELAEQNIRVNAVHPSEIATPMIDEMAAAGSPIDPNTLPVKRFGRPEEVSAVVLFLASDESSFVTGADYACDGGFLAA